MKKCPKCGTVLDDSKKKCYMCGADLQRSSLTFGDSFDSTVGATVSKNQGNAFSNVPQSQGPTPQPNPMEQASQQIQNVGGNVQNTNGFESGVFKNQMNSLNSMAYDDRSAIEKMFSSDMRFRSKSEINAQEAMMSNRNSFSTGVPEQMSNKDAVRKLQDADNNPANVTPRGVPANPMAQANPFANNMTGAVNPFNNGFN
ncbi:MAG: zinc ribbon domain-containing protein, partial [Bacilli bacterium]|nr:zinc ribbon domain-containing protein [Bacilli bacterium]